MVNKVKFGELLLQHKIITREQLEAALIEQQKTGEMLGVTLQRLKFVDEESLYMPILAQQIGVEFIRLKDTVIPADVLKKIPAKFAVHYKIVPLKEEKGTLSIAMTRPLDIHLLDEVALIVDGKIKPVLASEKDILEVIRKYYGVGAETIEQMMVDKHISAGAKESAPAELESEASISKFLNQIFIEAYKDRATDIHIEPYEDELKIRYRVDGILYDAKVPPNIKHFKDSINSRIKILASLNIAEKRLPQDGRLKVRVEDADLDLRVSFLPSQYGESVVLRVLNSARLFAFDELGLSAQEKKVLDELINKPHGIIFITGPTGSGKTTTLYSCLSRINTADKKIITIEDPIEYQLKGVTQVQINPKVGLSFAAGLRSMLRHDPDVMMVGEVRDFETAEIAVRIALTGHLVLSTLHTNDASSGITRLLDMGVEPFLISSSVLCIIAQRLVRVICPKCKEPLPIGADILAQLGVKENGSAETITYHGRGCEHCHFTGYKGRVSIYEFLVIDEEVQNMIMARATATQIQHKALEKGMCTLRHAGWEKIKQGVTTASEVIRVTQEITA